MLRSREKFLIRSSDFARSGGNANKQKRPARFFSSTGRLSFGMEHALEQYRIGKISVTIHETDDENRLRVECNDGTFHSEFSVSRYEYTYYKRHMNQKILKAYKRGHEEESS